MSPPPAAAAFTNDDYTGAKFPSHKIAKRAADRSLRHIDEVLHLFEDRDPAASGNHVIKKNEIRVMSTDLPHRRQGVCRDQNLGHPVDGRAY